MSEADEAAKVVGEWAARADDDLKVAEHTLKLGDECPTEIVCFHAQQCVEKYIKALLIHRGIEYPKTHDIEALLARFNDHPLPEVSPETQRRLTSYATATRYPGPDEPIPLREAEQAVAYARVIKVALAALLPAA